MLEDMLALGNSVCLLSLSSGMYERESTAKHGTARHSTAQYGTVWQGTTPHYTAPHGAIAKPSGEGMFFCDFS